VDVLYQPIFSLRCRRILSKDELFDPMKINLAAIK
jgi:hypothetical protein